MRLNETSTDAKAVKAKLPNYGRSAFGETVITTIVALLVLVLFEFVFLFLYQLNL